MSIYNHSNKIIELILDFLGSSSTQNMNVSVMRDILNESEIKNELDKIAKIDKNEPVKEKYIIGSFLAPILKFDNYTLQSWRKFENQLYSELRRQFPEIFVKQNLSRIRGDLLEICIVIIVNQIFSLEDIFAYRPSQNPRNLEAFGNDVPKLSDEISDKIIEKIYTSFKISGLAEKKIWGDNDILLISHKELVDCICILSCKSSLRERAFQSSFWSIRSRLEGKNKHAFCTLDFGNNDKSEIGNRDNDNNAKKNRDVLESVMDRVYVFRNEKEVKRSASIKNIKYLEKDLIRWEEDFWGL